MTAGLAAATTLAAERQPLAAATTLVAERQPLAEVMLRQVLALGQLRRALRSSLAPAAAAVGAAAVSQAQGQAAAAVLQLGRGTWLEVANLLAECSAGC